jgi:SAM-dependent methyltransferase
MRFLRGLPRQESHHGRLLDVGCGSGTFLCEARRVGYEVSGLDLSPEALSLLKARGIKAYTGSLSENSLGQQTFEVITLFHVLEHLADPLNDLLMILRHLAPGGDLIIQVPNRSSMQARVLSRRWYGLDPPRHLTQFSRSGLIRLIQRAGLGSGRIFSFSLRDNAPAIVSSLFPGLDPKARAVRNRRAGKHSNSLTEGGLFGLYFALVVLATPLALFESAIAAGGTLCLRASKIAP